MFAWMDAHRAGLRARLAEPHRAYHGQSHIDAMLAGLAALGPAVTDPATVELAIWYHDAIYDPAARDNEARSADLLRAEMGGALHPDRLEAAARMIALSVSHALPPDPVHADTALFLDLDLAILGADPAAYDAYEAGIAQEYRPIHGEEAYRAGRAAFLRGLLGRERLFLTERFHRALDAKARGNLRRVLREG